MSLLWNPPSVVWMSPLNSLRVSRRRKLDFPAPASPAKTKRYIGAGSSLTEMASSKGCINGRKKIKNETMKTSVRPWVYIFGQNLVYFHFMLKHIDLSSIKSIGTDWKLMFTLFFWVNYQHNSSRLKEQREVEEWSPQYILTLTLPRLHEELIQLGEKQNK